MICASDDKFHLSASLISLAMASSHTHFARSMNQPERMNEFTGVVQFIQRRALAHDLKDIAATPGRSFILEEEWDDIQILDWARLH